MSNSDPEQLLSTTWSLCPSCFAKIPASRVARGDDVYLSKKCPEHGLVETIIWRGPPDYRSWAGSRASAPRVIPNTVIERGCPFDCGLCPDHGLPTCCALLEVTQRCDIGCRFCFADSGGIANDPSKEVLEGRLRMLLAGEQSCNLQLSGGEPTVRDDLPEITAMARSMGFQFIQLNTNGLRLARDLPYLKKLKAEGISCVFLQFDGTEDEIYRKIRGRALLSEKLKAIEHCAACDLGVVLVPTLIPGINVHNAGAIVRFALQRLPAVRGVHFQPVSYFGRYPEPPTNWDRITIPEIIRAVCEQTGGAVKQESFKAARSENPYCSFHANFILMPEGELVPVTNHDPAACDCRPKKLKLGSAKESVARQWSFPKSAAGSCCSGSTSKSLDDLLDHILSHSFFISGMAFQDIWNLDLERLKDCHVHVAAGNSKIVPFCAYNLTDQHGRPLYRPNSKTDVMQS